MSKMKSRSYCKIQKNPHLDTRIVGKVKSLYSNAYIYNESFIFIIISVMILLQFGNIDVGSLR